MKSTMEKQQDGTVTLTMTIPWDEVKKAREEIINKAVETAEIQGFRKGKAPRNVVEKTLNQAKVRDEVLQKILPAAYMQAVTEQQIRPIINPRVNVEKLDDNADWVVTAVTCEIPEVKLGKYKDAVQKLTAKSKIIVPGKEKQEPSVDDIMFAILENIEIVIPSILTEQEVDRLLAQTLDEIKRLGLTLEQYLSSTGKTPEQLRDEYKQKASNDIKLEFALQKIEKIAETEKISVGEKEIEEAIQKAKDPVEKQNLENNRYLLASILRQQKTVDFLKNL
jgi:FKBP-type peptidyl-prolyl cis-trans isomerase (trigger factor)